MNVYDIGYGSCEESQFSQLLHENVYTNDQLEEIVHVALKKAYDTRDKTWNFTQYQEFHEKVIEILCNEHGFYRVEFTAEWGCFGWSSIDIKDSWRSYRGKDDTLDRFQAKYPEIVKNEEDDPECA
jgi:hypothetical protein